MKEEGYDFHPLSAPHRLIKGLHNEVDYRCWPGAYIQSIQCRPHGTLRAWAGNWAPVIIVAKTEPLSSQNHRKGKKKERAQLPYACSIREDQQNPLGRFKVSSRLFF